MRRLPFLATFVGRPLAASLLFDHPTVEALVAHLTVLLGPAPGSRAGPSAAAQVVGQQHEVYITAGAARFPCSDSLAAFEVRQDYGNG
jgi:hypothetical protein